MATIESIDLADGQPDAKAIARIQKKLSGTEQSPSARVQSEFYKFYQEQLSTLGSPYDVTHIPISVLEQMENDSMLRFGLHFTKTPIVRANWFIECERADIASFIDNALRRILAEYIDQRSQALSYGFAPIVKRFQFEKPNWTYFDPAKSDVPIKVWDNGPIDALTWKPFIGLPSDVVTAEPKWSAKGEFDGIKYNGGHSLLPFASTENDDGSRNIPVELSLWITNEKAKAKGSLWGFPRVGYAYRYWWSYWFRWALSDRFFERKADPPYVVYYPTGNNDYTSSDPDDPNSANKESMKQIALSIGEAAKGGGVLALPGDTVAGYDDRPTSIREWMIAELEVKGDMTHFIESFEYLDVMKLRSLWIPEQSLIEGSGGTSSRNVAGTEISFHKEASGALAEEIDNEINKYIIPDLVRANFPEFKGDCRKVTTGFTDADQETLQQALQWMIQAGDQEAVRNLDAREVLTRLGMPVVSLKEIARQNDEAKKALEESTPPVIDPQAGKAAGVNEQGFYVQQGDFIHLDDQISIALANKFVEKLPKSKHYKNPAIISQAKALRMRWKREYTDIYEDFADFVSKQNFSDEKFIDYLNLDAKLVPNKPGVKNWVEKAGGLPKFIADIAGDLISEGKMKVGHAIATAVNRAKKLCAKGNKKACAAVAAWEKLKAKAHLAESNSLFLAENDPETLAERIIAKWEFSREKLNTLLSDSKDIIKKIINQAGKTELTTANFDVDWKPDTEEVAGYLQDRGAVFVDAIDSTTRDELKTFLANSIRAGLSPEDMANDVREHFSDFPTWKADRLVRSEVRDAYNFATLAAGEQAGVKVVQARDAQFGDSDPVCIERNGKFFKIKDAIGETFDEHPNGTLEWILTKRENLSIKYVETMPDESPSLAYFDDDSDIVYFKNDIPEEIEKNYLIQLGEALSNE
jgi:SPP1 gp7 family putative phage head morphogenesis protein